METEIPLHFSRILNASLRSMKRLLFVTPLVLTIFLSACVDFQRRPYSYKRHYPHMTPPVVREPVLPQEPSTPAAPAPAEAQQAPALPVQ